MCFLFYVHFAEPDSESDEDMSEDENEGEVDEDETDLDEEEMTDLEAEDEGSDAEAIDFGEDVEDYDGEIDLNNLDSEEDDFEEDSRFSKSKKVSNCDLFCKTSDILNALVLVPINFLMNSLLFTLNIFYWYI